MYESYQIIIKKRLISIGTGFRLRRVFFLFRNITIFYHLQIILV